MKRFKVKSLMFNVGAISFLLFTFNFVLLTSDALASVAVSTTIKSNPQINTASSSVSTGLVGYWTFDGKDTINNIADVSGNYATGSLILGSTGNTSTTTEPGRMGQAIVIDGADDYVTIANQSSLQLANSFSLGAWVRTTTPADNVSRVILAKWNAAGSRNYLIVKQNSSLNCGVDNGSASATYSFTLINDGKWHFVECIADAGTGALKFYLDNKLLNSVAYDGTSETGTSVLDIGTNPGSITQVWAGAIDDVRIYNYALSTTTLNRLYALGASAHVSTSVKTNKALTGPGSGLVGYWTFDGKDIAQNIADISGNYATGSLILGSTGNTGTTTEPGRMGQAMVFDGLEDQVRTGTVYINSPTSTVSFWSYDQSTSTDIRLIADTNYYTTSNTFAIHPSFTQFGGDLALVALGSNSGVRYESFTKPSKNAWHFWSVILDNTTTAGEIDVYIDGVLQSTTVRQSNKITSGNITSDGINIAGNKALGKIDDVRIYNRALSAGEIKRLYALGASAHVSTSVKSNPSLNTASSSAMAGLVGYWTFDGKDITRNITDVSGNYATGSLILGTTGNTATTTEPGRMGQSMVFDGVDDYVYLPDNAPGWNFPNDVSVSVWIKTATSGQAILDLQNNNPLIYMQVGPTTAGGTANKFVTYVRTTPGSLRVTNSNRSVNDNKWHHLVLARSVSGQYINLYIDGVLDKSDPFSDTSGINALGTTGHAIGAIAGSGYNFNGLIDDLRIYNKALSASEVKRLYDLGR